MKLELMTFKEKLERLNELKKNMRNEDIPWNSIQDKIEEIISLLRSMKPNDAETYFKEPYTQGEMWVRLLIFHQSFDRLRSDAYFVVSSLTDHME